MATLDFERAERSTKGDIECRVLNGAHGVDPSLTSPRSGYNGAQLPSTELIIASGSLFEGRRLIFVLSRWVGWGL